MSTAVQSKKNKQTKRYCNVGNPINLPFGDGLYHRYPQIVILGWSLYWVYMGLPHEYMQGFCATSSCNATLPTAPMRRYFGQSMPKGKWLGPKPSQDLFFCKFLGHWIILVLRNTENVVSVCVSPFFKGYSQPLDSTSHSCWVPGWFYLEALNKLFIIIYDWGGQT
jgi:hypothetical protein